MSKVISGISMSLDGFVTGPDVTREQQLGNGGQILHQWLHAPDPRETELLAGMREELGTILMGRRSAAGATLGRDRRCSGHQRRHRRPPLSHRALTPTSSNNAPQGSSAER